MIIPLENNTNAIIKKLVKRNIESDKKKNIFCIMTITIAVALIVIASLTVQNIEHKNYSKISNQHQGIIYNVTDKIKEELELEPEIKKVGLCTEVKTVTFQNNKLTLLFYDNSMEEILGNALKGSLPNENNEIVVSTLMLDKMGIKSQIGDDIKLNLDGMEQLYKISGIIVGEETSTSNYPVLISRQLCKEILGTDQINAYIWLKAAQDITKEDAINTLNEICLKYGYTQWSISSYYDYMERDTPFANYIGYIFIAGLILGAAALVIYSVFYISIGNKIAQYGQLRTIGASKKQIYKIVIQEGIYLSIIGEALGIVVGTIISYVLYNLGWTLKAFFLTSIMAISFGTLLTYICVRKPAKIAASVSPIMAVRNQKFVYSYRVGKKKKRITPIYIAYLNLLRNKKKAIFTVLSMSLCSVLFILAATYYTSFNAEDMARIWDMSYGDFTLSIDLENSNEDTTNLLKKNIFSDELVENINNIEGVEGIVKHWALPVNFMVDESGVADKTLILGYGKNDAVKLKESLTNGDINTQAGDGLIVSDPKRMYDVYRWNPHIGQKVAFTFTNQTGEVVTKEYTISGFTSSQDGMGGYIFRMPSEELNKMAGFDCTYKLEVKEKASEYDYVKEQLRVVTNSNPKLHLETIEQKIIEHKEDNAGGFTLIFSLVIICALFAALSQINLSITNLFTRSKEIGILQSVGTTRRQLIKSFIAEAMFMSLVSIVIMFVLGIPGGFMIGEFLKQAGMAKGCVVPALPILLFIIGVVALQIVLSVVMINKIKKYSIIEQLSDNRK